MPARASDDPVLDAAADIVRSALAAGERPDVRSFFHADTGSVTHLVSDPATGHAAIIDSVLDYDHAAGRVAHDSADRIVAHVDSAGLCVDWHLETHVHADHLSAAHHLRSRLGGRIAVSAAIEAVRATFAPLFGEPYGDPQADGSFDLLLRDGDRLSIGELPALALHVPGHTPADLAYVVGDVVFPGDTLFMPDYGTARADFPGGDARGLYRSIRRLLALPAATRMFVCHDYKAPGRSEVAWETSVGAQRANVHAGSQVTEDAFAALRRARDAGLAMPRLLWPSVQANLRGGQLPAPGPDGRRHFRIPIDALAAGD